MPLASCASLTKAMLAPIPTAMPTHYRGCARNQSLQDNGRHEGSSQPQCRMLMPAEYFSLPVALACMGRMPDIGKTGFHKNVRTKCGESSLPRCAKLWIARICLQMLLAQHAEQMPCAASCCLEMIGSSGREGQATPDFGWAGGVPFLNSQFPKSPTPSIRPSRDSRPPPRPGFCPAGCAAPMGIQCHAHLKNPESSRNSNL